MPILAPEPFSYPDGLFDDAGGSSAHLLPGDWLVMHTKSRAEKALARWLYNASIPFFLPLYRRKTAQNGKVLTSYTPLFSGYVFVRGDSEARYCALSSNQVAHCLPVHDQDRLSADLANVYRLMTGDLPLTPAEQIPPGSPVEVIEGPFAGMTGTLIRHGAHRRLFVAVRMINQGVSVELNDTAVRPLTENGAAERARIALIRG